MRRADGHEKRRAVRNPGRWGVRKSAADGKAHAEPEASIVGRPIVLGSEFQVEPLKPDRGCGKKIGEVGAPLRGDREDGRKGGSDRKAARRGRRALPGVMRGGKAWALPEAERATAVTVKGSGRLG